MPNIDFAAGQTKSPVEYTAKDFLEAKQGTRNGIKNGLKIIIDVEGKKES